MIRKLLCLLGFHRWQEIGDPEYHAYGGKERCKTCGKEKSWSNSIYG